MNNTSQLVNNANSTYNLTTPSPPLPTTTTTTHHTHNPIINIDISEQSDSTCTSLDSGDDAKEEAINLEDKAIEMNMRMIRKGREEITKITRRSKLDRSKDDIKRRKVLKQAVKLLDKERKEGEQVATVFCITNNGKYLIGNEKLTSPECLELVMDYYSDDNDNDE